MSKEGTPSRYFYCPPKTNPLAETGRNNQIHLGYQVYPYGTGIDCYYTDPRGKRRYPRDKAAVGSLEGGGGGDRYRD